MNKKLAITLVLVVMLPLIAIAVLGIKVARDDSRLVAQQYNSLIQNELAAEYALLKKAIDVRTSQFEMLCHPKTTDRDSLQALSENTPFAVQFFLVTKAGKLEWPTDDALATPAEKAFLSRTAHLWQHRYPFRNNAESIDKGNGAGFGYRTYFWDRGIQFIYWSADAEGQTVGFEIEKARFVADLIDALPSTPLEGARNRLIRLISENGQIVYQYGGHVPAANDAALAETPLPKPFASWRLQYFAPMQSAQHALGRQTLFMLATTAALLILAVLLVAYVAREYTRESRNARQQVNFVNQVSHELKTPLTNIRMYAELLAEELDENDPRQQRYIGNITSESQRLSRLIENVLSFARSNRRKLSLRISTGCVDDVIREALVPFSASLQRLELQVETDLNATGNAAFDRDLVRQVLTNLISNVEKYAHRGKWMKIESQRNPHQIIIRVRDKGPGIPEGQRESVFLPFLRLENKITEGVAGTGIGLSISRELARLHGGDLRVEAQQSGACFEFSFRTDLSENNKK